MMANRKKIDDFAEAVTATWTPRQIEERRGESISKSRKKIKEWAVFKSPVRMRKTDSVEEITQRVDDYIKHWDGTNLDERQPPTIEEFANNVGFSTTTGLFSAIKKHSEDEIGEVLSWGVEQVRRMTKQKMMLVGERKADYKAYAYLLDNIDGMIAAQMETSQVLTPKEIENKKKNEELSRRAENMIREQIEKFTKSAIEDEQEAVIEVEYDETEIET